MSDEERDGWGRGKGRRKEHGEPVAASARQLEAQLQPGAVTSTVQRARRFTEKRVDSRAITVPRQSRPRCRLPA